MKAQKKSFKKNNGNIMLLCVVAIAIMVTLSNLVMALVVGRSQFTKKVASINDTMLLVEDANIQYQKEFLILQSENIELVEYYFVNRFYTLSSSGFSGANSTYNSHLKGCIEGKMQRVMNDHYVNVIKKMEKEGVDQDIGAAEEEIREMADFLYAYLTARRMSQEGSVVTTTFSMNRKLTLRTDAIVNALRSKGEFKETKRTADMKKGLYVVKLNLELADYYEACWPGGGPPENIGTYVLETVLKLDAQSTLGVNEINQRVKFTFMPAAFTAVHNGFGYDVEEDPTSTISKMETNKWIIEGK